MGMHSGKGGSHPFGGGGGKSGKGGKGGPNPFGGGGYGGGKGGQHASRGSGGNYGFFGGQMGGAAQPSFGGGYGGGSGVGGMRPYPHGQMQQGGGNQQAQPQWTTDWNGNRVYTTAQF